MNFEIENSPHFVVEVLGNNEDLQIPKYHSFPALREEGYDFKSPLLLINAKVMKTIEGKDVPILYRSLEGTFKEAKERIALLQNDQVPVDPLTDLRIQLNAQTEENVALKIRVSKLEEIVKKQGEQHSDLLRKHSDLLNIMAEQMNTRSDCVTTVSFNYLFSIFDFLVFVFFREQIIPNAGLKVSTSMLTKAVQNPNRFAGAEVEGSERSCLTKMIRIH